MTIKAETPDEYLSSLPEDRRHALSTLRELILKHRPAGIEEGMQYGMIGYYIPHSIYPKGYHCNPKEPLPFIGLGSQKNHMAIYCCTIYGHPDIDAWFRSAYAASGKKLDMGKGCIRFKRLDDLPLNVIAELVGRVSVDQMIASVEAVLAQQKSGKR